LYFVSRSDAGVLTRSLAYVTRRSCQLSLCVFSCAASDVIDYFDDGDV
jgi:hypothetical protein